jgi:hypothetical protein
MNWEDKDCNCIVGNRWKALVRPAAEDAALW